jgi:hypothetical protein
MVLSNIQEKGKWKISALLTPLDWQKYGLRGRIWNDSTFTAEREGCELK